MVEPQTSRFWHVAEQSGLLDARSLQAFWEEVPPEKRTPDSIDRRLARRAVEAGTLTLWQAQQLLAGRSGFQFDRYLLLAMIGEGGMGRVYLAKDTRLDRKIALKVLSRERMNNPRAVIRFRREAKVGAQLQHENLVRIYDQGEANGHHYLVMEYIEGKTVGRLIHDRGRLPPAIAARITRQVALGLEHAQQKGMIHRDVNPMNILVDRLGTAKLTDLGLAIMADEEGAVTRDGATVGTFDYIAPEQARSSRNVDTRADIYSLGCSLYHMIAGRVPFPQPSLPEKLYGHQALEPEPLTKLAPGIPEALDAVVRRMMAKSPDDRFQTPLAVALALEPLECGPVPLSVMETAPVADPDDDDGPVVLEEEDDEKDDVTKTVAFGSVDVATVPKAAPAPVAATPRTTSDPLMIDLGAEPPLSASVSGDHRAMPGTGIKLGSGGRRTTLWVGAGVTLVFLVWIVFAWFGPTPPLDPKATQGAGTKAARLPVADVAIRWSDSEEDDPQESLRDAVSRAAGRGVAIVLGNSKPLELDATDPINVPEGGLEIRAFEGTAPVLIVKLEGNTPFLRTSTSGSLTLRGLTIRAEPTAPKKKGQAQTAVLIEAGGDLTLDRCLLATPGDPPGVQAVNAHGLHLTLTGCQLEGFAAPLTVDVFPQSRVHLANCLINRARSDAPAPAWALHLANLRSRSAGEPQLNLEDVTIDGYGLLAATDFAPDAPLLVEIVDTIVRGPSLLHWSAQAGDLKASLPWTGRGNRYDLSGPWVASAPGGNTPLADGPTDLASWSSTMGDEPGTRAGTFPFTAGDPVGSHRPADYTPSNPADAYTGALPAKVGPPAPAR
ncbi:MAG: serine/threonine-protein kinase [Isosphaeraceae bacterium]